MHCTACGQHNHEGVNFCGACGNALPTEANAALHEQPGRPDGGTTTAVIPTVAHDEQTEEHQVPPAAPSRAHLRFVTAGGVILLVALLATLSFVVLRGGDGPPPSQEALDGLVVDVVDVDGQVVRLQVPVDFAGSVDNIALYADGALVDQAANLGGSLVWTDPPEGQHDLVLRAQKGDIVLIGAPTTVIIRSESTLEEGSESADTTPDDPDPDDAHLDVDAVDPTTTTSTTTTTQPPPSVGPYVSVLASLPKDTVTLDAAEQSGQNLTITFGLEFYRVIDSDNWASLRDGFWVIATSRNFETLDLAAAHCWELGATDANTCFGRPVTQNPDDVTVVGVPAP